MPVKTQTEFAAVILAAGRGTRMKSDLPKVLHKVAGLPMIRHVTATVAGLAPSRQVVVVAPGMQDVTNAVSPIPTAVQIQAQGTADAVKAGLDELFGFDGDVLVLFGDTPLITRATLRRMLDARRAADDPAVVVLGFRPDDPGRYGRLIIGDDGSLSRIVEAADLTEADGNPAMCNAGVMAIDGTVLTRYLRQIGNDNAKGEYYLTDLVSIACGDGRACAVVEADPDEVMGVDSRAALAVAEGIAQQRLRQAALEAGVTLIDPATTWFSHDTKIGADTIVEPSVWFGPKVVIGKRAHIKAFSHVEGATLADDVTVGPFARLRPGTELAEKVRIGNYVEVKNAALGPGAKVNHLSYVGDAVVGASSNLGAGTITCNYDGYLKHQTVIGERAFIGSNTALVAPVVIGAGAIVAAGSTITKDVAADALAVARERQHDIADYATRFQARERGDTSNGQAKKD